MKPEVIMMVGLPGSGKSTWINNADLTSDYFLYSTDSVVEEYAALTRRTYSEVFPAIIRDAEKMMNAALAEAIKSGRDVIWDQTNLSVSSRKKKLARFPSNYRKVALVFPTPAKEQHEAWLNSPERDGKWIPPHILASMTATFEMPTEAEGFHEVIMARS